MMKVTCRIKLIMEHLRKDGNIKYNNTIPKPERRERIC